MNKLMCFDGKSYRKCDIKNIGAKLIPEVGEEVPDNYSDICILPAFVDVHVHFREPGFSYKETIKTGSMAAAAGGYTHVCTMPNLKPVPDSLANLKEQLSLIDKDSCIGVHPYATITAGQNGEELSDMESVAPYVAGFSDDGKGVQSDELMKKAMIKSKSLNKIIVAHCEVNSLLKGGYIHDGEYALKHGHKGICSASEYEQIARDIELVREIGVKYHVCHISTKESVELIRKAKSEGLDITCETGPHYLVLSEADLQEDGRFKMNPPLRSGNDKQALIEGLKDGTIDMIATDHAPHSAEEKSKGLAGSAMGIVGLETAFSVMYTNFVKTGIISFGRLIELMHYNPKKRFGITNELTDGNFTVFNLEKTYTVNPDEFQSMGKATPFAGAQLNGKCVLTCFNGNEVWREKGFSL